MFVCTVLYTHTHTHIHTHTHAHTHIHMCTCTHLHTHVHVHTHTYTHMCTCTHTHTHMYTCTHTQIYGDTTPLNETASQFRDLTANLSRPPTPIADVYLLQLMLEMSIGLPPLEFIMVTLEYDLNIIS